jgi:hypothetical protein
VNEEQRERVRQRYAYRCGYCGVHEADAGATLTIDHYRPRRHGGGDEDENLVYCCPKCNECKGAYWHETDPRHTRLLHPLRDDLGVHTEEDESGQLVGLTPEGVFFIRRLHLNRTPLVTYRLRRRSERELRHEADVLRQRVDELQQGITELFAALEAINDEVERESQM